MNKHLKMSVHYLIRSFILLGFAGYIVYLAQVEKLQYYIVPRMIPYVQYTTIALYALAIYFIYLALQERGKKQHKQSCGCSHEPPKSVAKSGVLYSLFLFPILIGFLLPDKIMGSDVVSIKGMNLNVSAAVRTEQTPKEITVQSNDTDKLAISTETNPELVATPADSMNQSNMEHDNVEPVAESVVESVVESVAESVTESVASNSEDDFDILFPSDQYSVELAELGKKIYMRDTIEVKEEGFLEMLTMLDMYRNNFVDKTIHISGFVYREDGMSDNTFVVSRMAMQCCSADAMPYGFLVYTDDANQYELDTWITVEGKLGLTEYNDVEIVQLEAEKITRIEAPSDPYVYPYFDDLVKLAEE